MITLYDFEMSGNCYKARLMLALLGLDYQKRVVDLPKREQLEPWYLKLNPLHKVPVLDDGGTVIRDSQAILVYLAAKYGKGKWLPASPEGQGEMQQWLSLSANELFNGNAVARALIVFKREGNLPAAQALARDTLAVLDGHLATRDWLVGTAPTVADIACYPYAALSHLGQIDMAPYAAAKRWFKRVESLPGYIPMPGLPLPA